MCDDNGLAPRSAPRDGSRTAVSSADTHGPRGSEAPAARSSARGAHPTLQEYVEAELNAEAEAVRLAELALASGEEADRVAAEEAEARLRAVLAARPPVLDEVLATDLERRIAAGG